MGKYENIKDHGFDKMAPEKRKQMGAKGGKASGEAKRTKKLIADTIKELLEKEEEDGVTLQEKGCAALLRKYARGNLRAFEIVRDTIGEKPTERVEVKANVDTAVAEMEEYLKKCARKSST